MEITNKILEGDVQAAARLMTDIEDEIPSAIEELKNIYAYTGRAYIVGITGAPGAGKSSLVDTLISIFRKKDMTVGVIAVDPTSPFTGGAILGDRVRMQEHSTDQNVFIRSLAARGWEGGLSRATVNMVHIMDAMNKDIILIETVGSGQSEVSIAKVADTSIIVLTPGMGDMIQTMKAGILEAANIFVINKADKDGTNNLEGELGVMLAMRSYPPGQWKPSIFRTEAIFNKGTEELAEEVLRHKQFLIDSGELEEKRREKAKLELIENIEGFLKNHIYQRINESGYLEKLVDDLAQRKIDPHSAALKIVNSSIK